MLRFDFMFERDTFEPHLIHIDREVDLSAQSSSHQWHLLRLVREMLPILHAAALSMSDTVQCDGGSVVERRTDRRRRGGGGID